MRIGLDLDGTIAAAPDFYCFLARAWREAGGEVHVVTSRDEAADADLTREYLSDIGLEYDVLVFTWDKAGYAERVGLRALVDDLDPFLRSLPENVLGLRACAPQSPENREAAARQIDFWRRERDGGA